MTSLFRCYLVGGLGNQAFQHVVIKCLKNYLGKDVYISSADYMKYKSRVRKIRGIGFCPLVPWLTDERLNENDLMLLTRLYARSSRYLTSLKACITDNFFLDTTFNEEEEFFKKLSSKNSMKSHCITKQVLDFSLFNKCWHENAIIFKNYIAKKNIIFRGDYDIAIHVRRGDYLNFPDLYYQTSSDYFNNAIEEMKKRINLYGKPKCLIIGSDREWAKSELRDDIISTYQYESELYDFGTIVNSRNIIVTNSSFSVSAAMYSKSINSLTNIIAPKNYYSGKNNITPIAHKDWLILDS